MMTKLTMSASAIALGTAGIIMTFVPEAVLGYFSLEMSRMLVLLVQILGALYFAFGMLNWMSKASLIGGIYNRPIAVANFSHFFIAGLALIKSIISNSDLPLIFLVIGIVYLIFALLFGLILFKHPIVEKNN
ncbi:MAG: hypothetical protein CO119_08000 [Flavobacteriales bacterium CG_4_9_14_3_um_filter_40_17]|nr:MAG: hypothetical protein CO119_08000 [Flavobacteriales bacterium CG_4_9_14_3_um_filter_40_17]